MFGDVSETLDSMRTSIAERLGVHTAFGEPVTVGGVTVIPVAKIAMGFGGGGGVGSDPHAGGNGDAPQSVGGGGGGGGVAQPLGFIEVSETGARWVPVEPGPSEMVLRALTLAVVALPFGGKRSLFVRLALMLAGQTIASRLSRPDLSALPENFRFGRSFSRQSV